MTIPAPALAYRGHPALTKEVFVAECRAHREADRLLAGTYQQGTGKRFKACAVGCAIRTIRARTKLRPAYDDHRAYADLILGGREELAHLEDAIFEGLPEEARKAWPERFAQAIPDGADLSGVHLAFLARALREVVAPTVSAEFPAVSEVVERVAAGSATGWVNDDPSAARAAAWGASNTAWAAGAAASAARAAAWAARAAASAARDAASAARAVAWAASDTASVARDAAYQQIADILCECLALAPIPAISAEAQP